MTIDKAKSYADREARESGIDQYVYRTRDGDYCVTDTDSYYRDETGVGWFDPQGQWHAAATEEVADPTDKTSATYDHDLDPNNDPKWWCVFDDDGWAAHGYTTRAEAEAFYDGVDYCQTFDLELKGIFEANDEGAAIDLAKAAESEPD